MTKFTDNIKHNKARCRVCNDVIESKHRHDFVGCKCGAIFVDGGKEYLRRGFKTADDIEELSEYYTEKQWKEHLKYLASPEYKDRLT